MRRRSQFAVDIVRERLGIRSDKDGNRSPRGTCLSINYMTSESLDDRFVPGVGQWCSVAQEGYAPEERIPLIEHESIVCKADVTYQLANANKVAGVAVITNFRLLFIEQEPHVIANGEKRYGVVSVPLGLVHRVDKCGWARAEEVPYGVEIVTKDAGLLRFGFQHERGARRAFFEALQQHAFDDSSASQLPYTLRANKVESDPLDGWNIYISEREYERQGACTHGWRPTYINKDYSVCDTYPALFYVPANVTDEEITAAAVFRSRGRVVALSWVNHRSVSISRCSQPNVGMLNKRCMEDEKFIRSILDANPNSRGTDRRLVIMDARPRINAVVNQAKGQGVEAETNYENCEIRFLDIANIHVMRDSLKKLHSDQRKTATEALSKKHSVSEAPGWLSHVRAVLEGATAIVRQVEEKNVSVLVHCSDGWDRTSQLCSLAMLMMDPYYRTRKGFAVLIEKEWITFGHKFSQRMGHGSRNHDDEQRSPIFLQFIDCVWQIHQQFPMCFEFNEDLLVLIIDHAYMVVFGTFLGNNESDRDKARIRTKTMSLWTYVGSAPPDKYSNKLYNEDSSRGKILIPNASLDALSIWNYHGRWLPTVGGHALPRF